MDKIIYKNETGKPVLVKGFTWAKDGSLTPVIEEIKNEVKEVNYYEATLSWVREHWSQLAPLRKRVFVIWLRTMRRQ